MESIHWQLEPPTITNTPVTRTYYASDMHRLSNKLVDLLQCDRIAVYWFGFKTATSPQGAS